MTSVINSVGPSTHADAPQPPRQEILTGTEAVVRLMIEQNVKAFRWGRALVADPQLLQRLTREAVVEKQDLLDAASRELIEHVGASGELAELLASRIPDLIGYQSPLVRRPVTAYSEAIQHAAATVSLTVPRAHRIDALVAKGQQHADQ